ncbi:MAG TPA: tRNA(His) guanylyltransferase Thg1 family protein [Desulfobacteria bacterium]|nr:tRNA(His) guanylyltransferase Thg1 family protein [Desulfobacteria bacterium]
MTGRNRARPTIKDSRDRDFYAEIRAIPPLIVRADGRNFRHVLRDTFEKPYDERFAKGMAEAAVRFFEQSGFNPTLAYLFSDKINLHFTHVPFKGRIEKLDSVIAGFLASALTIVLDLKDAIAFDARIIPVCHDDDALAYLMQRQAEAWRNHINAYGYYGLQESGLSAKEAEKRLKGMKAAEVHELLFRQGLNLNETPAWQRRGIIITKEQFEKAGYNPKAAEDVTVARYKVVQLWDLPLFGSENGRTLLNPLITGKALPKDH